MPRIAEPQVRIHTPKGESHANPLATDLDGEPASNANTRGRECLGGFGADYLVHVARADRSERPRRQTWVHRRADRVILKLRRKVLCPLLMVVGAGDPPHQLGPGDVLQISRRQTRRAALSACRKPPAPRRRTERASVRDNLSA